MNRLDHIKFYRSVILAVIALVAVLLLPGCDPTAAVKPLFKPSPDKDVTSDSYYSFSSFTNTVWKSKTQLAIADGKRYTGAKELSLLVPQRFDPSHPRFTPSHDTKISIILPVATRIRIDKLMQDQGAWGGLMVIGSVENGTNSFKDVRLDGWLLEDNQWLHTGTNKAWCVNPEFLEKP